MAGQTPKYGLGYVEKSDTIAHWPEMSKKFALKTEAQLNAVHTKADTASSTAREAKQTSAQAAAASVDAQGKAAQSASAAQRAESAAASAAQRAESAAASAARRAPRSQAGTVSITVKSGSSSSVGTQVALTGFSSTPTVVVSLSSAPGGSQSYVARTYGATASSFNVAVYSANFSTINSDVTVNVSYIAIEGA